jgi:hypothetical protein
MLYCHLTSAKYRQAYLDMAQNPQDDNAVESTEQSPSLDSTKTNSSLSTDEVKATSKPSVIRPLRPLSSEVKTTPMREDDPTRPSVKFSPSQSEDEAQQSDALLGRSPTKDSTRETAVLSESNPMLRRVMSNRKSQNGTARLGEGREVLLVIRGMVERVIMVEGKTYKLGRFEIGTRKDEEIDLSPYGALDRGVSRIHAELSLVGDKIYITDLMSTNGTYLAGQRLKPNEAMLLRKGDELHIGRLPIQVLFS